MNRQLTWLFTRIHHYFTLILCGGDNVLVSIQRTVVVQRQALLN